MASLESALRRNRKLRALGFDDAPFDRESTGSTPVPVPVSGILCSNTRMEGMLHTSITRDGFDATETLIKTVRESKFYEILHIILLDGVTMGGFNVIHLPDLAAALQLPCVSVMRRPPNRQAMDAAAQHLPRPEDRIATLDAAGEIHAHELLCYQVQGTTPELASQALDLLTDRGKVPEPLRLAHLIGSAIVTGQSSNRA